MSLEAKIEALTAAVEANTAALKGAKGGAPGTADPGKGKSGKTSAVVPKNNIEAVKAAAVKVKDKLGREKAKELIADPGMAEELAKMKPENYDAFVSACEAALSDDGDGDSL